MTIAAPDLLTSLVLELRHELHYGNVLRLHLRSGEPAPESDHLRLRSGKVNPKTGLPVEATNGHAATLTGQPFTFAFERRLAHRDWWGSNELGLSSISEVGDFCRSRHQSDLHRSPGRSTSLCERIVSGLAEFGQPLEHVAWREGIDPELAYALAVQALRHGASWRHRELHRYMRTARERERDSRVDCPACLGRTVVMRRRRPAA